MLLGTAHWPVDFVGQRSNNRVTRSKRSSNFKIAITASIFKLERRSKVQYVGNWTSGYKAHLDIKMAAIWKILKYFRNVQFANRYGKIVKDYPRKSIFNVDDVTDDTEDVTARHQTWPPIFMFERNCHIFSHTGRSL